MQMVNMLRIELDTLEMEILIDRHDLDMVEAAMARNGNAVRHHAARAAYLRTTLARLPVKRRRARCKKTPVRN